MMQAELKAQGFVTIASLGSRSLRGAQLATSGVALPRPRERRSRH